MDWRSQLRTRLADLRPASLCVLDDAARALAAASVPAARLHPLDPLPDVPCTMALGIDVLDGLDAPTARHLIHRLRLYAAPRLLLAARPGCALDDDAFRALGFVRESVDPADGTRIQSYDLATYKSVPDWLNARFWAHPERWEP